MQSVRSSWLIKNYPHKLVQRCLTSLFIQTEQLLLSHKSLQWDNFFLALPYHTVHNDTQSPRIIHHYFTSKRRTNICYHGCTNGLQVFIGLKIWECSFQFWSAVAGQCTLQSTLCFDIPVPWAWSTRKTLQSEIAVQMTGYSSEPEKNMCGKQWKCQDNNVV